MTKRLLARVTLLAMVTCIAALAAAQTHVPTLDDLLTLKSVGGTLMPVVWGKSVAVPSTPVFPLSTVIVGTDALAIWIPLASDTCRLN